MGKGARFAVITILVIAILGLQLYTLHVQTPRTTTMTETSTEILTNTLSLTSTTTSILTTTTTLTSTHTSISTSTSTLTTSSDDIVLGSTVSPWKVSNGAGGYFYPGVTFNFTIAPFAPYLTNNSGYKYVNLFFIANLYNSSGSFLAVTYAGHQLPPGAAGTQIITWLNFGFDYPGFPAGFYVAEVTPVICSGMLSWSASDCFVAGHTLRAGFAIIP